MTGYLLGFFPFYFIQNSLYISFSFTFSPDRFWEQHGPLPSTSPKGTLPCSDSMDPSTAQLQVLSQDVRSYRKSKKRSHRIRKVMGLIGFFVWKRSKGVTSGCKMYIWLWPCLTPHLVGALLSSWSAAIWHLRRQGYGDKLWANIFGHTLDTNTEIKFPGIIISPLSSVL